MPLARTALLAWCACGIVVSAHHSTLAFDGTKPTVITGVVSAFHWAYPHTSIVLDVSDGDGKRTRWTVESESLANAVASWLDKELDQTGRAHSRDRGPRPER